MNSFKKKIQEQLSHELQSSPLTVAAYEGGSAATKTSDEYSDIDLVVIGNDSIEGIFKLIEDTLGKGSKIQHTYVVPKTMWPGCYQKFYFLEEAPKHFFVDVAVFLKDSKDVLTEFLQPERHGEAQIYFDKEGILKPRPADPVAYRNKHQTRLEEIIAAYPLFKTTVLKELDRGNSIDAFSFYFAGMVRPLVELMGMMYRPFKYDFGFRYLYRHFPREVALKIEKFLFVSSVDELRENVTKLDQIFHETVDKVKSKIQT